MTAPIPDRSMYASTAFTKPEEMPSTLKRMDEEEKKVTTSERKYIQNNSSLVGPGSFSGASTGLAIALGAASALTPVGAGPLTAAATMVVAPAVATYLGFKAGQQVDKGCCPEILENNRIDDIPQKRYNRIQDKLERIEVEKTRAVQEKRFEEAGQLERAKEHFQRVKEKNNIHSLLEKHS